MSITSRGSPAEWADDEPELKTAVGLPFEAGRRGEASQRRKAPSAVTAPALATPSNDDDDDFRETVAAATSGRSTVIVIAILVPLFIAAVVAVLYAAGLPPFERDSPVPTRTTISPTTTENLTDE